MNLPIVRLELEGMKAQIVHAFNNYAEEQKALVRDALDRVCTPTYLSGILHKEVERVIKEAIANEVKWYFSHGDGRKVIANGVMNVLKEIEG